MHWGTARLSYYLIFSLIVLPLIAWEWISGRAENVEDTDRKEPLSCRAVRTNKDRFAPSFDVLGKVAAFLQMYSSRMLWNTQIQLPFLP